MVCIMTDKDKGRDKMVLKGETIYRGAPSKCEDCGTKLELQVLSTCGYYVGTQCQCGPFSRETGYYQTREEAEQVLNGIALGEKENLR
mgnify:CR=1 FL=1